MSHGRIAKKITAYAAYHKQQRHVKKFGIPSFQVAVITQTKARAENLRAEFYPSMSTSQRRAYHFTVLEELKSDCEQQLDAFESAVQLRAEAKREKDPLRRASILRDVCHQYEALGLRDLASDVRHEISSNDSPKGEDRPFPREVANRGSKESPRYDRSAIIRIKLVRSTICAPEKHKVIVRSLGLKKLNRVVQKPDTPIGRQSSSPSKDNGGLTSMRQT